MMRAFERHFWMVTAVAIVGCAILAAKAINNVMAADLLGDSPTSPAPVPRIAAAARPATTMTKDGSALIDRNMFCSDCAPPVPEPNPVPSGDGDALPSTSLPIELVATSLAQRTEHSYVTVRNTASGHQGAFWVGDRIPGAGPVEKIAGTYLVFRNSDADRLEKVSLLDPKRDVTAAASRPSRPDKRDPYAASVRKLSDTRFEVDREMVTQLIANPTGASKGGRARPYQVDGQIKGVQLFAVRQSSVYAALGLRNGDKVLAINGYELTSPDKMLQAYSRVKDLSNLALSVNRGGKDITIEYAIR